MLGCHIFHPQGVPFTLSKPECVIGGNEDYYAVAGIVFTFYNTSAKKIKRIEISCMIYDAETKKNPFIGSNLIKAVSNETIESGESKELIIPLDKYVYRIPEKPYLIDHFFIRKLTFSDGSVWEDKTGAYKI
jgi:hypothetical protein